ncbi:MAG TPA: S8 family peptidase [Pyrinomonadaceae bacterium]|jgi:subtilisin family serine protease|nr:S8 family peptidase [Pyrinomonadaceae bacterium]
MRKIYALLVLAGLCAVIFLSAPVRTTEAKKDKLRRSANKIENSYIVVLDDAVVGEKGLFSIAPYIASELATNHRGKLKQVYQHAINGFAVEMTPEEAEALSQDFRVAYVEEDSVVTADVTQSNPPWGLDRIDQRNRPLSATYTYNWTGAGVRAYVIDTGILTSHTQFGGRASNVFDAFGGNGSDCNGHGTHVSGTIGGSTYGVAKSSMPRGVRVLDCSGSGSTSGVISGVDWVRANFIAPAVANMSLGGGASSTLDTAVNNLSNAGVPIAVAAGNSNTDACTSSPARAANAITTGSTTTSDARSSFSNFGTCVDLFAPGSGILSAWWTSTTATATLSGTSMASPHVAGVAALYKQANPSASAATVRNAIVNNATTGVLSGIGTGSPNRLLYSLFF